MVEEVVPPAIFAASLKNASKLFHFRQDFCIILMPNGLVA